MDGDMFSDLLASRTALGVLGEIGAYFKHYVLGNSIQRERIAPIMLVMLFRPQGAAN
jgi:hypothetical protein